MSEDKEGKLHFMDNQMSRNGPRIPVRRALLNMVLYSIRPISMKVLGYGEAVVIRV
jgi:hypothetical protein